MGITVLSASIMEKGVELFNFDFLSSDSCLDTPLEHSLIVT